MEESAQSQASVFAVVPVTLFIMVTLLMIQLQTFNRLFLVLSVIPMGLIQHGWCAPSFNKALGFVAILGVLSLTGMIARNGVILIEQVEAERKQGKESWNAVIDAAVSRFRPIMLTAISTVLGLIPIALTIFWGRMRFSDCGFCDALLRMLSVSRTEDQDNVDKEDDQVHRPLEDGCARSGESERAEHEGESEKGHADGPNPGPWFCLLRDRRRESLAR